MLPSSSQARITAFFIARRSQLIRAIRRLSYRLSAELAEDVAHDAYVVSLNHAGRIGHLEDAQLWCWFWRTSVRLAKDRCRRKSYSAEISDADGTLIERHGGSSSVEHLDLLLDLTRDVVAAADKYGGNEKDQVAAALILVIANGAKVTEAAHICGTHREYVSRAVGALRIGLAA